MRERGNWKKRSVSGQEFLNSVIFSLSSPCLRRVRLLKKEKGRTRVQPLKEKKKNCAAYNFYTMKTSLYLCFLCICTN